MQRENAGLAPAFSFARNTTPGEGGVTEVWTARRPARKISSLPRIPTP